MLNLRKLFILSTLIIVTHSDYADKTPGPWSSWTSCSVTFGGGQKLRIRAGGDQQVQTQECNRDSCTATIGGNTPSSSECKIRYKIFQKSFSYSPLDFESKVRKVSIPIGGNGCRSYFCFLFVSIYSPEVMNTEQCNFFIRVQIRAITVSFLYLVPWHQTPSKSSLIVSLMVSLVVI